MQLRPKLSKLTLESNNKQNQDFIITKLLTME